MNVLQLRQVFDEAKINIGRNGVEISYPPRHSGTYRNTTRIKDKGMQMFREMIGKYDTFQININLDGLSFLFVSGDTLETIGEYDEFSKPVTWESIRPDGVVNDIAAYNFEKHFNGVNLNNTSQVKSAIDGVLDEFLEINAGEYVPNTEKWNAFMKNFKVIRRYFGKCECEEFEETMEISMYYPEMTSLELGGLPKSIFLEMLNNCEEINISYGCGNKDAFVSILFVG